MPEGWRYAVGVGSNLGDRRAHLTQAATLLDAGGVARVISQSDLIETAPVGGPGGQGAYLNGVWIIASTFGAHQLLAEVQRIESACGRVRTVRWGPRTIDLDLLLRDDGLVVSSAVLEMPHPRLAERLFVLQPLAQVAGAWPVPGVANAVVDLIR
ncbi:MAG TPA: 2-amino-4-hydroxy-6-hydroxymethyldihydropteridine diphosphokinase [Planctomycetota bacterium]|nr:2-amino-4-hydroxy-6-hydroxymethyldihydropteridine diphosphokinase [Planctomycetota bacterium]